jgi:hypothetical protein
VSSPPLRSAVSLRIGVGCPNGVERVVALGLRRGKRRGERARWARRRQHHVVAVQVAREKSKVCNRFFTMGQGAGSRVATGRLQAMGQLDSTSTAPHHVARERRVDRDQRRVRIRNRERHLVQAVKSRLAGV